MADRKQVRAVVLAVLMVGSVLTVGAGSVAAQPSLAENQAPSLDRSGAVQELEPNTAVTNTEPTTASVERDDAETANVAKELRRADGEQVLLLSVERNLDRDAASFASVDADTLRADSRATLRPVAERLAEFEHADIRNQFWAGNVLSVEVDLDEHDVERLAAIDGVTAVAPNADAVHPAPPEDDTTMMASTESSGDDDYTYGLEQIDVPGFEERYGDRGGNASVAVIDDGISNPEAGHPDLTFATEAVAVNGSVTTGTLGSAGSHGEHVAGTAAGAAEPAGDVPRYGVAPESSLVMINAFEGGATAEDILASVQYSAEQDVDVATMSLGFESTTGNSVLMTAMEETIQDANAAGTLVVGSAGNAGAGDDGGPATSPGAEFSSFSVGASNAQGSIAPFSSGSVISPFAAEYVSANGSYPANYPREYVKPDVVAPGVDVLSAGPLGTVVADDAATYSESGGTSMAAPHVAGAAALVQSATEEELAPKTIQAALVETADKPDNEFAERHGRDVRYGTGIINVTAATAAVKSGTMGIEGTVTDTDGDPIPGAAVTSEGDALTSANVSGDYTLRTTDQSTEVTADAFGYEASSQDVDDGSAQFTLDDALAVDLIEGQSEYAEFDGQIDATVDVRNLDNVTVEPTQATDVDTGNLTLRVAGDEASFGEPVELDGYDGLVNVTVDIDGNASVEENDTIGLEHTFRGLGESTTVESGPTTLTAELDPAFFELDGLTAPETLAPGESLDMTVEVTNTGQVADSKLIQTFVDGPSGEAAVPPEELSLEPGETTTYELSANGIGSLYDAGSVLDVGFRTADGEGYLGDLTGINDEISAELALQAQGPQFSVTSLEAPTKAGAGEEIQVNATVENVGSEADQQDVAFRLGAETLATETVELDAFGLSASDNVAHLSFTVSVPEESDIYEHGVYTDDDSATGAIAVDESYTNVTVVESDGIYEPGQGERTLSVFEEHLAPRYATEVVEVQSVDDETIASTDVFVFHDFGTSLSDEAIADLITTVGNDSTTRAVYLEQAIASNAISDRSRVTGDPDESPLNSQTGAPPVEFEIEADHPIFEGVGEPGETVTIHDGPDSSMSWFEGPDGDTLARVADGSDTGGPSVAVDPETGSVLLASIAPFEFPLAGLSLSPDAFTDDAGRLLANSVAVADDDTDKSVTVDTELVGTVDDASDSVTVTGSVGATDQYDGEEVTVTVGGEPVTTATVDGYEFTAEFDPTVLDLSAQSDAVVDVAELSIDDTDTVDVVHETRSLEKGYNLLSVPQSANLSADGVGAVNVWNASAGSYESATGSEFDSPTKLHQGLYVSATDDDARLGFTFGDDVPTGGTADLAEGWTLAGSNFAIDSTEMGDTRTLDEDLVSVDPSGLTVFGSGFNQQYDGQSTIGAYDAYWVRNSGNTSHERAIVSPSYDVGDREDVLGVNESAFEITGVETSVRSTDEVSLDDDVLGSDEDVVAVDVTVTNDGRLDTQFVDLHAAGDGEFALAERSAGVTLDSNETETVTLYYALERDDPPTVDLRATTDDDAAETTLDVGGDGLTVEDQALTLDDEFVVSSVDYNGEATVELVADGEVLGTETVDDGAATDLPIPLSNATTGTVEVRLLNADGEEQANATATVSGPSIEIENGAPAHAFPDSESVDVPANVTNNALIDQMVDVEFAMGSETVENETATVAGQSTERAATFAANVSGLDVGDSVEHTVSAAGASDTATLTVTEAAIEFRDQGSTDGTVLVENVTAEAGQSVVVTNDEYEIVDNANLTEDIVDGEVEFSLDSPGEHVAHVVADTDDAADDAGLVSDQATVSATNVTIESTSVNVSESSLPYSVEELDVAGAGVLDSFDGTPEGANYTIEIRRDGANIGESDTLNGNETDVTVPLDEPITADSVGTTTAAVEAVLVDESGTAIPIARNGTFTAVSDDATVTITAGEAEANVALPDQTIDANGGSDAVRVENVTGTEGQYVVLTDADLNVVGTYALEERIVDETLVVDLNGSVEPGEYRAHLTSDVGLLAGDALVTDAGELSEAANFDVGIDSVNDSVTAGENVSVTYTVENTGGVEGTQSVSVSGNGTEVATDDVTLAPGANQTLSVTYVTDGGDTPAIDVDVESENDSATATVGVTPEN